MASNQLAPPPIQTVVVSDSNNPVGLMSYGWIQWLYTIYSKIVTLSLVNYPIDATFSSGTNHTLFVGLPAAGSVIAIQAVVQTALTSSVTVTFIYNGMTVGSGTFSSLTAGSIGTFTLATPVSVTAGSVFQIQTSSADTTISMLFTVIQQI